MTIDRDKAVAFLMVQVPELRLGAATMRAEVELERQRLSTVGRGWAATPYMKNLSRTVEAREMFADAIMCVVAEQKAAAPPPKCEPPPAGNALGEWAEEGPSEDFRAIGPKVYTFKCEACAAGKHVDCTHRVMEGGCCDGVDPCF